MLDTTNGQRSVLGGIVTRQSVVTFRAEVPPRALISQLLAAAVMAPNHHLTQPWRFFVLSGSARQRYAEVVAASASAAQGETDPAAIEARLAAETRKALRAPLLILVASIRSDNPRSIDVEDLCATAAGVQNLLVAAPDLGLAAYWRTGAAAYDEAVKAFYGLRPEDHIVAHVYVGYPETVRSPQPRRPVAELTTWLE